MQTTPLESWCLSLVRRLKRSEEEHAKTTQQLARAEHALLEYEENDHKKVKLISRFQQQLSVTLDGLAKVKSDLMELRAERNDWHARYQRSSTDLDEALRMVDEIENKIPPAYNKSTLVATTAQLSEQDLVQRHMRSITHAKLDHELLPDEAFAILSKECRQASHLQHVDPTVLANTIFFLVAHTVELDIWSSEIDWMLTRVKIQMLWCVLDDSLLLILKRSLYWLCQQEESEGQDVDSVSSVNRNNFTSVQASITVKWYLERVVEARRLVRRRVSDDASHQFLRRSFAWLCEIHHDELGSTRGFTPCAGQTQSPTKEHRLNKQEGICRLWNYFTGYWGVITHGVPELIAF